MCSRPLVLTGLLVLATPLAGWPAAADGVPRATFGRVPVPPLSVDLLTPPKNTPTPVATFTDVSTEERTLPLTRTRALQLRFDVRIKPAPDVRVRPAAPQPASETPDAAAPRGA